MGRILRNLYIQDLHYHCDQCLERDNSEFYQIGWKTAPVWLWNELIAKEYKRRAGYTMENTFGRRYA